MGVGSMDKFPTREKIKRGEKEDLAIKYRWVVKWSNCIDPKGNSFIGSILRSE
jgi:hypothetical protein